MLGKTSKKTVERVKLVSLTLPLPFLLKEWKTKEWNIGMFETPIPPAKSDKFAYCYHQRPQLLINFKQENIIPKF